MRILHVGPSGPILDEFVRFVNAKFEPRDHLFMLLGPKGRPVPGEPNVVDLRQRSRVLLFGPVIWSRAYRAEKIILHGLFNARLLVMLFLQPWLLKKCAWAIWGGDLYSHRNAGRNLKSRTVDALKRRVVRRLGHLITHIRGDYELAREWFGARGQWHDCFMYPSNQYRDYGVVPKAHDGVNILLGNSATRTNCHAGALEILRPFANHDIRIFCPLSYGDESYGKQVAALGEEIFGDKFVPLQDFMSFEHYLELLATIDIAVFNHDRQQAVGNITQLLGLGKKVYIRKSVTTWDMLEGLGLPVFAVDRFDLSLLPPEIARKQMDIVLKRFSPSELRRQWAEIYE